MKAWTSLNVLLVLVSTLRCGLAVASDDPGGSEVGNGGDVIICDEGPEWTIEVLDLFEAREYRGLVSDLHAVPGDAVAKAKAAIDRLLLLDRKRRTFYRERIDAFYDDMNLIPNTTFPDVKDSDHFPLPNNCKVGQAVIQRPKKYPHDKRYFVNARHWQALDDAQKAILVLHEIIYEDALRHGHTNSVDARYFNSLLFSNEISKFPYPEYRSLLSDLNLTDVHWFDQEHQTAWTLSEVAFPTFQAALNFCDERGMDLVSMPGLSGAVLNNLRKSFLGTYYIEQDPGLTVWSRGDFTDDLAAVVTIAHFAVRKASAEAGKRYLALCFHG